MKKIHQDNLDEKFVSRRQGFDGRLLKVMVDTVTLPIGRQTTREIIAHPGAVCVVPVLDDGSIIFVNILFGGVTIVAGIRSFQSETGPYA